MSVAIDVGSKKIPQISKKIEAERYHFDGTGWAILKTQRWQVPITQERRYRLSCGFARRQLSMSALA